MSPRLRGALAGLCLLAAQSAQPTRAEANPTISQDFQNIMGWLTHETAQGLAFNTGSTFDPPNELKAWRVQPDVSLGVGFIPFNKAAFPELAVAELRAIGVQNVLPSSILFPNLTLHLRMGLPERWDASVRLVDMTVPNGYKLTPSTTGGGQSNTIGFGVRKHLYGGGELPLLSLLGNVNHVFGHFDFLNTFQNIQPRPGFFFDSKNTGRLDWNVTSVGVNAVASQNFGAWTPFLGLGLNRVYGTVHGKLTADYGTPLALPDEGEAASAPEENQGRVIFGAQYDRPRYGIFLNGEVKAIGAQAGKTFIVSLGVASPFSIGSGSVAPLSREASRRREAVPAERPGGAARPEEPSSAPPERFEPENDGNIFIR